VPLWSFIIISFRRCPFLFSLASRNIQCPRSVSILVCFVHAVPTLPGIIHCCRLLIHANALEMVPLVALVTQNHFLARICPTKAILSLSLVTNRIGTEQHHALKLSRRWNDFHQWREPQIFVGLLQWHSTNCLEQEISFQTCSIVHLSHQVHFVGLQNPSHQQSAASAVVRTKSFPFCKMSKLRN
jgi:hypothetical protein